MALAVTAATAAVEVVMVAAAVVSTVTIIVATAATSTIFAAMKTSICAVNFAFWIVATTKADCMCQTDD